jgi:Transcriptional regulator, AbiEi antitoxin, Type IV TA system/Transcriptional regulator, AbiEi antitoxin N-terminal domain
MAKSLGTKLNRLERDLPEGLIVDAAWLTARGYSPSLRNQYVASGWLEKPAHTVYRRPRGTIGWEAVIISLQMLMHERLVVGGRTALELQGYSHYLAKAFSEIHLYGPKRPPAWLDVLKLDTRFVAHNSARLFPERAGDFPSPDDTVSLPWGQWKWPLVVSCPERAVLELLDELPARETFHQVDKLFEGLTALSPRRLQPLLESCRSVKVKRLFFFFADRHGHAWLKRLDKSAINLGSGKRKLVDGGKLDPTYQITVPEDLDGIQ